MVIVNYTLAGGVGSNQREETSKVFSTTRTAAKNTLEQSITQSFYSYLIAIEGDLVTGASNYDLEIPPEIPPIIEIIIFKSQIFFAPSTNSIPAPKFDCLNLDRIMNE